MTKLPLGTIISIHALADGIAFCRDCGMETLQLRLGDAALLTKEDVARARKALAAFPAQTAIAGYSGPKKWDFRDGPRTIGISWAEGREERVRSMEAGVEVCAELGIPLMTAHLGFVPENPCDAEYAVHVDCLRRLNARCDALGVRFCLETGQETPITLRRLIEDAGAPFARVNFDPANLLMYGRANPQDAAVMLAKHVSSMHVKDGRYPGADSYELGEEAFPGEGLVDFPAVFRTLLDAGFAGPLIIEREIPEPRNWADIRRTVPLVRAWLAEAAGR